MLLLAETRFDMATDIDRLHRVVEGKERGRGRGKTFARCHEVAGFVELGYKHIFCLVTRFDDWRYIDPMLDEVLTEHGIQFQRQRAHGEYRAQDSVIRLIPEKDHEHRIRGYECVLVRMGHWD